MDQNDATRGVSRDLRGSEIASFLKQALAGGEETVVALQKKARAAGLLGERQTITDSKSFGSDEAYKTFSKQPCLAPARYLSAVIVRRSGARRTISLRI